MNQYPESEKDLIFDDYYEGLKIFRLNFKIFNA